MISIIKPLLCANLTASNLPTFKLLKDTPLHTQKFLFLLAQPPHLSPQGSRDKTEEADSINTALGLLYLNRPKTAHRRGGRDSAGGVGRDGLTTVWDRGCCKSKPTLPSSAGNENHSSAECAACAAWCSLPQTAGTAGASAPGRAAGPGKGRGRGEQARTGKGRELWRPREAWALLSITS